jgi:LysM repeat protein
MVRWKRLFYYLMINVVVSGCTTVSVLFLWDRYSSPPPLPVTSLLLQEARQTSAAALATDEPEFVASPTPKPTRALATYQVLAGDTLSQIALIYEISVLELMEINGMTDPDALGSGQLLFVPAPLLDASTAKAGSAIPAVSTPQPEPGNVQVVITIVFGAGDLPTERVRVEKKGEDDLSLSGWKLIGESGTAFVFPHLALYQDSYIDIYSRNGVNSAFALYWGLDEAAWITGEQITLLDKEGNVRSTYRIP